MINVNKLKSKVVERGMNVEDVAKAVGLNPSTMYRRLSVGGNTFTIAEAIKLGEVLGLTGGEMNSIFFAGYVAEMRQDEEGTDGES